ncbi:MAG: TRAP transporter small permease subunit [Gammaproteobacteria bacterium]|nr:TRAP transporter small permease subunit [Gammaproteobacteria bacterium]
MEKSLEFLGRCVSWLVYAMAGLTVLVVIMRYVFEIGTVFPQELVAYMHALVFMFGLSYTLKHDAHVRVDLLYSRLDEEKRALINFLGHLVFLIPVACTIGIGSLDYVIDSWRILERSAEVRGIPAVYLLKTVIPVSALLLVLQSLLDLRRYFKEIRGT